MLGNRTSYAGFFDVAAEGAGYEQQMFAWYFPAVGSQGSYPHAPNHDAPLLMWLQGGPGGSSMFGLFVELGPFRVTASNELEPMPHTWCDDKYSCLFIDNPVGAGFSYTTADDG